MFARCGKVFVVLALVLTTGLHWAALQTAAWTTMFASNLRSQGITEAVTKTFDGKHPCCLCKAIAAAKKSERKSEAVSPGLKLEFPPVVDEVVLIPSAQFEMVRPQNIFADSLSIKPPVPPPRDIAA